MNGRVVLLAGDHPSTRMVYHALAADFSNLRVVLEEPAPRRKFIWRRLKKLGIFTVAGQILFRVTAVPILERTSAARIELIKRQYKLDDSPITSSIFRVPSVNSPIAREVLQRLSPQVVVVNGTRIIGRETLALVNAPFVNTHAGITPLYRGVHGGYWALRENRPDLAGTTVHFVDEGIDTGSVIEQAYFNVSGEDSFVTYPYLHIAVGLPILVKAVREILNGTLTRCQNSASLPSKLRTHPTLWSYVTGVLIEGVR
jgi:folate-dependent phosphoribosylglycinamide formyltransferase PurN